MQAKVSILFYAKRAKANSNGLIPIYLRVTVDGQRIEVSTKRFVEGSKWSVEQGRMKGNSAEAHSINCYLDILKGKVYDYQKELIQESKIITAETMRNKLNGTEEKPRMLIPIFQDHNDRVKALIDDEFSPSTYKRYCTSLKHTINFIKWKFNTTDIDIRKIDYCFIADFEFYFRSVRKCNNNSTVKYIRNFGKVIRICIANGWLDKNPFVNYKTKVKEVDRVFLTEEELQQLVSKVFSIERLNQVRDIFVFSCFTGLAYVDVKKLTKSNVTIGIDREKWIYTNRQKTETPSNIPLLPIAEEIILKYSTHPKCLNENKLLPVLSNQKMNAYLKEMADVCGIDKELTFHIARHTFATTVTLTNGVPIESVSKMLGHKNLRTTQHYAKILDRKVSEDMLALKIKFLQKDDKLYENNPINF